jgi:hypothetical protein
VICSCLWLDVSVFTTIRSNFNYFDHSYNYDATIGNFIISIGWFLGLFSSTNMLICPINRNNQQINGILKVFYSDIKVYFYVCIKIIFTTYYIYHKYIFVCIFIMCMYVYCSYNESKNYYLNSEFIIQIWKLMFQLWNVYIFEFLNWYLNLRNIYVNLNFFICILIFSNKKSLFESKHCYSSSKTFYLNLKINIWTLNIVIQIWKLIFQYCKFLFQFWKLYLNLKIVIPILKQFIWI